MSEFKGTPADKWVLKRLKDNYGIGYSTLYEAHIDIGPCMIWAPDGNAEQLANAKLIAAAPDLLKALQSLLDDTGDCECGDPDCPAFAARAAIAKATY